MFPSILRRRGLEMIDSGSGVELVAAVAISVATLQAALVLQNCHSCSCFDCCFCRNQNDDDSNSDRFQPFQPSNPKFTFQDPGVEDVSRKNICPSTPSTSPKTTPPGKKLSQSSHVIVKLTSASILNGHQGKRVFRTTLVLFFGKPNSPSLYPQTHK